MIVTVSAEMCERAERAALALGEEDGLVRTLAALGVPGIAAGKRVNYSVIARVAEALGVSPEYLIDGNSHTDDSLTFIAALRQAGPDAIRLRRR